LCPANFRRRSATKTIEIAKTIKKRAFSRTDRKMAAQMGFCPHEWKVGSHGAPNRPHGTKNLRPDGQIIRMKRKLSARTGD
jgi:hypothetical protein